MVQTKCKLNNAELFVKLVYQRNRKQKVLRRKQRELEKLSETLMTHSWLNAAETKLAFVKGPLYVSSKSTAAANVYLMKSLL